MMTSIKKRRWPLTAIIRMLVFKAFHFYWIKTSLAPGLLTLNSKLDLVQRKTKRIILFRPAIYKKLLFTLSILYFTEISNAQNTLDVLGLTATTPAAGAYSLRKLSNDYTGPLARITIGNSYYDVYPDASGNKVFSLNSQISAAYSTYNAVGTGATNNLLSSIAVNNSATVAIWYDQSGNSADARQATLATQPEVINTGVINIASNVPTIKFSGSKYLVVTSTAFNNDLSGSVVYNASTANTRSGSSWYNMNGIFASEIGGITTDFGYGIYNGKFTAGNGNSSDLLLGSNTKVNDNATKISSWTRSATSGSVNLFTNSYSDGSATLNPGARTAVSSVAIGAATTTGGVFFTGSISELVLFPVIYSSAQQQAIEANQTTYYNITQPLLSTLTTNNPATNITPTSATLSGTISSDGGAFIYDRGFVYSINANPVIGGAGVLKTSNGTDIGAVLANISGLTGSTTYHYQAYAINLRGTAYGGDQTFTTVPQPVITASGTLSALTTTYGTASTPVTFNVSGVNISVSIVATAPAGFELSTDGISYKNSVTIGSSGTVASTPVYVRLTRLTGVGTFSGNVVLSSLLATNVNVATAISTVNAFTVMAPAFSYATPQTYHAGTAIQTLSPVSTGGAVPATLYSQVTTFAGSKSATTGSADGMGTAATFNSPSDGVFNSAGDLFVTDNANNVIRMITPGGVVSTFATIATPSGITIDANDNLYVTSANAVYKITPAAVVSLFAGNATLTGRTNSTGASARFNGPAGITFDGTSNLYVADVNNNEIRRIVISTGLVSLYAGSTTGAPGRSNSTRTGSTFNGPTGLSFNPGRNILYVADAGNNEIRSVGISVNTVNLLAGSTTALAGTTDGTATAALFSKPYGIVTDLSGNIYVTDQTNRLVRKLTSAGVVTTIAGNATAGTSDGTGSTANFSTMGGLAMSSNGNIFIADKANHNIRMLEAYGFKTTPALPAGLSLSGSGAISGTPTTVSPAADYVIQAYNTSGSGSAVLNITVNNIPEIATSGTLSALNTTYGTASTSGMFNISGTNMNGSILVTPPLGFEVSSDNINFTSTLSVGAAGTISSVPVYIRLTATSSAGTYDGDVVLSSTGAPNINMALVSSTIAKATASIILENLTHTYDGSAKSATSTTNPANLSGITITYAGTTSAPTLAGTYAVLVSLTNANYTATNATGNLIIDQRSITITADAKSKTYGDADPVFTYAVTSGALVNADALTGTLARNAGESVNTYAITQGTVTAGSNYNLTYIPANLTIGTKAVTITADAKNKTYGDADPIFTYAITNGALVNTDVLSGTLTRNVGENVNTYAITQGNVTAGSNYTITYVPANLTIEARSVTVSASAKSKTYGNADPVFTYAVTSGALVNSDTLAGTITRDTGESVNTYAITQGTITAGSNYTLTYVPANLTIGTRAVTVTADAKSKTYGDADPALTYTFSPAIRTGDAFTGSLTRATGENAGTYVINKGSLEFNSNYTLNYTGADLLIAAKTITVTGLAKSKAYGDADPELTFTFSPALQTGNNFSGSLTRVSGESAGSYIINQGTLALGGNYAIDYLPANLTVNKAIITVTASNIAMCQADGFPAFGISYSGFKITDNENSLSTRPTVTTPANRNNAGTFPLVASGGLSDNYSFVYVNGTLTINALPSLSISSNKGADVSKGETAILTASGGSAYSWSVASGIISGQNTAILTVRPAQTTTYTVRITNASGCSGTASITIKVAEDYKIAANNILTPNGDGVNDTWIIQNIHLYPGNTVRIFDRNGREMYNKQGYDNSWNGTVGGNQLAEGTYYYTITYGPDKLVQKGFITIIRNR